uniref:Succinate dehydrogenase subunit 3 n=1 Tax=Liriodendron tulipifera TaxID=3415 RepID=M9WB96_LIRTU|nr:succinate dehydrogenase subunit 3 [Liriodendron tulipifera]AGJ90402.1 succinate dehydrogenase subunit 3 [Liriodendron tulipifera]QDP18173.1 succinate dehydrogenase subunit 3 [Liriodendron tulipifera]
MKKIHRPLPPHLTLYMSQLTSTFPISHRISGAFLATMVLFSPFLCPKMGLISLTYENFYQSSPNSSKFIPSSVGLTAFALAYHLFHGVRHLLPDFGHLLLDVRKKMLDF